MYSTNCSNGLRYTVTCIINQSVIRLVDTIVDTGAKYTCYRARLIDSSLTEEQMIRNIHKDIGGFVDGERKSNAVRFYQYCVKQFTIGNIDLGKRNIWVTFDQRVKDNVLGMDILHSVNFMQYEDSDELLFFGSRTELRAYVVNTIEKV